MIALYKHKTESQCFNLFRNDVSQQNAISSPLFLKRVCHLLKIETQHAGKYYSRGGHQSDEYNIYESDQVDYLRYIVDTTIENKGDQ